MNKSLMTGIGIGVVVAAAAGAVASLSMKGESTRTASVEQSAPLEQPADAAADGSAIVENVVIHPETRHADYDDACCGRSRF